mgnify:CR=1 FL=1
MRSLFNHRIFRIIFSILIYIASLGLCLLALISVPYFEHEEFLRAMVVDAAEEYSQVKDLNEVDLHTFGGLYYNEEGICTQDIMPQNPYREGSAKEVFGPYVASKVPSVMSGEVIDVLVFSPAVRLFSFAVGAPVIENGHITGAIFIIRNLRDLFPSLIVFIIVYTIIYLLAAVILISMLKKRQRYMQMERDYVANFSHDLKSPISSIRALSETMLDNMPEDKELQRKYCAFIISESKELENTVKNILELSSVQNLKDDLRLTSCYLKDILKPVFDKYNMLCYDMMIDLDIAEDLDTFPAVYTNPDAVSRIMDILLGNAVKFVKDEGYISVSVVQQSRKALICVRDNGIGIDKETQKHIFDRFFMGDKAHNSKGSGLGLAIAQELILALDEKIYVESSPGNGSAFFFTVSMK